MICWPRDSKGRLLTPGAKRSPWAGLENALRTRGATEGEIREAVLAQHQKEYAAYQARLKRDGQATAQSGRTRTGPE